MSSSYIDIDIQNILKNKETRENMLTRTILKRTPFLKRAFGSSSANTNSGENYFKLAAIGLPTGSFAGLCGKLHVMMNISIYILLFSNPI